MRIAVYLNQPVYHHNKRYLTEYPYLIDFFGKFALKFDEVRICVPLKRNNPNKKVSSLKIPSNVRIVALPYYENENQLLQSVSKNLLRIWQLAYRQAKDCDVVGYTSPSFYGCIFSIAAFLHKCNQFELVRGDKMQTLRSIYQPGFMRVLYLAGVRSIDKMMDILRRIGRIVTFTFGDSLGEKYQKRNPGMIISVAPVLADKFLSNVRKGSSRGILKNPAPIILYVGRLSKEKGLEFLLDAAKTIRYVEGFPFSLRIVGEGPIKEELENSVIDQGLKNTITFKGFRHGDELITEYDESDILVLPSLTEGIPGVIAEAMARNVAVIATQVGGIPEMIEDGKTGLLVEPANSQQLTNAIIRLIKNTSLRQSITEAALQSAQDYSLEYQSKLMYGKLDSFFEFRREDNSQGEELNVNKDPWHS